MNVIYHHKDLDGVSSGTLAMIKNPNAKLIGYHYGEYLDIKEFSFKPVTMIDVTLPFDKTIELEKLASSFELYDHHVSFYEGFLNYLKENKIPYNEIVHSETVKLVVFGEKGTGKFFYSNKFSAAELYMNLNFYEGLDPKIKKVIHLLGQYDTWRNNYDKQFSYDQNWDDVVMPFQYAMRKFKTPIDLLLEIRNIDLNQYVSSGKAILEYENSNNAKHVSENAFTIEFQGLKIIACNGAAFNSNAFKSIWDEKVFDAMMPFKFNGKAFECSLYTTKNDVDILSIAKHFGGGGHAKACGFTLPSTINSILLLIPNFENLDLTKEELKIYPATEKDAVDNNKIVEAKDKKENSELLSEDEKNEILDFGGIDIVEKSEPAKEEPTKQKTTKEELKNKENGKGKPGRKPGPKSKKETNK